MAGAQRARHGAGDEAKGTLADHEGLGRIDENVAQHVTHAHGLRSSGQQIEVSGSCSREAGLRDAAGQALECGVGEGHGGSFFLNS